MFNNEKQINSNLKTKKYFRLTIQYLKIINVEV